MSQPLVLAIEPDLRQAAIVKRIVREKALADVAVVDTRDAAIEAMRTCMPDVLLLSALLSPRDEDELIAHLKTLDNAGHLQTHTIPQLASSLQSEERSGRGLLSAFRRKKDPAPAAGCDPDLFADEIRVFLNRAEEKKRQIQDSNQAAPDMRPSPAGTVKAAAPADGDVLAPQASSWSSPFEWKPAASWSRSAPAAEPAAVSNPSSLIAHPGSLIANPESLIANPESSVAKAEFSVEAPIVEPIAPIAEPVAARPEPVVASPEPVVTRPEPRKRDSGLRIGDSGLRIGDSGLRIGDSGLRIGDSGLRISDPGSAIRDQGLVWLRRESDAPEPADGPAEVRALLSRLAVPRAVASVSYPRGCRIRRVRVPAAPDAESAEAAGAVVAAGRGAADRDRRPSA